MARVPRGADRPGRTAVVAGLAVLGSYLAVRSGVGERVDLAARARVAACRTPRTDRVVAVVTDLASVYGLTGVAGALAAAGHRRLAAEVGASGLLAWTGAQAAKPLLDRARPYEQGASERLVAPPAGTSWPSGHAAVAAAMATVVLPALPRRARPAVLATVAGIGVTRLHVGVHHLTDVVAGYGVGVLSALAARRVVGHLRARQATRRRAGSGHRDGQRPSDDRP